MAERDRQHLFIEGRAAAERYRRPPRGGEGKELPIPPNRTEHARTLVAGLEAAEAQAAAQREAVAVEIAGTIPGIYVSFESFPDIELAFEGLDPRQGKLHPQLRSVREVVVEGAI